MKRIKLFLTAIGVTALITAGGFYGSVAASEIGTTLEVERTACVDPFPSRVSVTANQFSSTHIPANPPSTTIVVQQGSTTVDYNISTCHDGAQWRVYVDVSNFVSGDNTISAVGTLQIRGSRGVNGNQDYTYIMQGGSSGPALVGAWQSLMTVQRGWVAYSGQPIEIGNGTGTRATTGTFAGFRQSLQWGYNNIPSNTPPGTYVATQTVTLTVGEP